MYFLENAGTEPEYNLALEEHLCRRAARDGTGGSGGLYPPELNSGFFMLWRNAPSVIIGRFQDAASEVNAAFVGERRLPVLRRNSGGGAVYHDLGNVNYSFILPDRREFSFAFFAEKIIGALTRLGAAVAFSQTGNDIAVRGAGGRLCKVSGMAQFRHDGVLLCHGTLLFDCDLEDMARALHAPDEKLLRHGVKSVRSRVANLKPFLPHVADAAAFMALLRGVFPERGAAFALSPEDEEAIRELMEKKYRSRAWNEEGRCEELKAGGDI